MKTVIRIPLHHLRNEEYFQYYTAFRTLAEQLGVEKKGIIDQLFIVFLTQLNLLSDVLEQIQKSRHTELLNRLDKTRDNLHRGITRCIGGYVYHFDPARVAAARTLKTITDHYGNVRDLTYNEETAAITNLVHDLKQHNDAMQLIHVADWVEKLDEANRNFDAEINERYAEMSVQNSMASVRSIRTELDGTYRKMVRVLEAFVVAMPEEEACQTFIDAWNARVQYYKHTLDARKGKKNKQLTIDN